MSWDNRVIWSEGTFLQPQHFQQHDRYFETYVELRARALRPYSYGFLELALDDSLLELGMLALPVRRPGGDEAHLGTGDDGVARYVAAELEIKDSNASFDRTALIQIGRLRLQLLKPADLTAAYSGLGVA